MKSNRIVNRLNRIAFIGLALALSFMCAAQTRPQAKSKSPKAVTDNRTNRLTQKPAPSSLGRINSRSDFDLLARVSVSQGLRERDLPVARARTRVLRQQLPEARSPLYSRYDCLPNLGKQIHLRVLGRRSDNRFAAR